MPRARSWEGQRRVHGEGEGKMPGAVLFKISAWILNRVHLTRDTVLPESIKFSSTCWEKGMGSHTNSGYKGFIQKLLV